MAKLLLDAVFSAILFFGSITFWVIANSFPAFERYKNVDSDLWPKIIFSAMALLSLYLLCHNLTSLARYKGQTSAAQNQLPADTPSLNWKKLAATIILIFAYFWGLFLLGFLLATIIFLAIAINIISYSNTWVKLTFPVAFPVALMMLFAWGLSLPLPRGISIFYDFSRFFY